MLNSFHDCRAVADRPSRHRFRLRHRSQAPARQLPGRTAANGGVRLWCVASDDVGDLPVGETVFGEPRMVGDPRITTAQAGVILKMSRQRVWNLIGRGDLPAYGPRNSARRLKLSDVQQLAVLGEPICVGEAARILRCPTDDVRALIRSGRLRGRPGSRYPVYRPAVEELARRSGVDSRDSPILFGPVRRVPTSDAARIRGVGA
jgi:excisionase family DNA binding protein